MKDQVLRIIPLGGLGEIGKNMMVVEWQDHIMIIDAGVMFPQNDMWGIDLVIPDFRYLVEKRDTWRGLSSHMVTRTTPVACHIYCETCKLRSSPPS